MKTTSSVIRGSVAASVVFAVRASPLLLLLLAPPRLVLLVFGVYAIHGATKVAHERWHGVLFLLSFAPLAGAFKYVFSAAEARGWSMMSAGFASAALVIAAMLGGSVAIAVASRALAASRRTFRDRTFTRTHTSDSTVSVTDVLSGLSDQPHDPVWSRVTSSNLAAYEKWFRLMRDRCSLSSFHTSKAFTDEVDDALAALAGDAHEQDGLNAMLLLIVAHQFADADIMIRGLHASHWVAYSTRREPFAPQAEGYVAYLKERFFSSPNGAE